MRRRDTLVGALVLVCVCATPAWAYIDPGTSSIAYQVLLAGILAVGFAVRRAWGRLATLFRLRRPPTPPSDESGGRE